MRVGVATGQRGLVPGGWLGCGGRPLARAGRGRNVAWQGPAQNAALRPTKHGSSCAAISWRRLVSPGEALVPRLRSASCETRPATSIAAAASTTASATGVGTFKYRYRTRDGHTVSVVLNTSPQSAKLEIVLQGRGMYPGSPRPDLHWGLYRASASQWYHPKDVVPNNSHLDAGTGAMRSPMWWESGGWMCTMEVPAKLLPLHLAFVFYYPDGGVYELPTRGSHMSIPLGMSAGEPQHLGATLAAVDSEGKRPEEAVCAVNFAVFSRNASAVYLCLLRVQADAPGSSSLQAAGALEISLDPVMNRTGDVWHVCVHGLRNLGLMCYGWRADGDLTWESGGRFHPGFILCDPYASRVVPVKLPEAAYTNAPRMPPSYDVSKPVMLASLSGFTQTFQWHGAQRPLNADGKPVRHSLEDTLIMELDVNTFTAGPDADGVKPEHRGKLLGIMDRLQDIVGSGATAVLLGPCCVSVPGLGPWGRSPVCFMAPDPQLAVSGVLSAASEFKTVIATLHRAGIEVLMSVEFCITGEGADAATGGLQGMRGLDTQVYYRTVANNTTVLAAGHPVVRQLVLASLRQWARDFCLDGFAFINAENMVQDKFGVVLDNPPLAEEIAQDPMLKSLKLIAVPGNNQLLPRGGTRGFPHWGLWQQHNDRFQRDIHAYLVNNTPGLLSSVATRITGSADLFAPQWNEGLPGPLATGRRAAFGVLSVTPPGDKPLLRALGADTDLNRAEVQGRTLLLALMTSAGCPSVSASTLSRRGLWRFVSGLMALRHEYGPLVNPPMNFLPVSVTPKGGHLPRDVVWHTAAPGADVDWAGISGGVHPTNALAYLLRDPASGASVFVALNPYPLEVSVSLPLAGPVGISWRRVCDTALLPPEDFDPDGLMLPEGVPFYVLQAHAGILLVAATTVP